MLNDTNFASNFPADDLVAFPKLVSRYITKIKYLPHPRNDPAGGSSIYIDEPPPPNGALAAHISFFLSGCKLRSGCYVGWEGNSNVL